jgi:signal transduction histidine kinase
MTSGKAESRIDVRAERLEGSARCIAGSLAALGLLVLAGWATDTRTLMSGTPRLTAMNPVTAITFVLAAASLWNSVDRRSSAGAARVGVVCAWAVVVIAAVRLIGYVGPDLGIDRLVFPESLDAEPIPNRMAPNTATAFLLAGIALLGLRSMGSRTLVAAHLAGLAVLGISMFTLCGYAYRASGLTQVGEFIPMAFHTAAGFAALSVGILFARPRVGMVDVLVREETGSRIARKLLPAVIGIAPVLGLLRVYGEHRRMYDSSTGTAIMVASWVGVMGATVWWQARVLNRADVKRTEAEREVEALNSKLRRDAIEIEATNRELEAFSYSVSHDLRAPLRSITGFSQALLEDHAGGLDEQGRDYLDRVVRAGQRMAELIEDIMVLSRISRKDMQREPVDLSVAALDVAHGLSESQPQRNVEVDVEPGLVADGDPKLLRILMENLLANAWKFTALQAHPRIEVGALPSKNGERVFYVQDNGAGFDMEHAGRLFTPFQRLHSEAQFPGNGVGLATVQRVVRRHGGRVWAQGKVSQGATFFFTV